MDPTRFNFSSPSPPFFRDAATPSLDADLRVASAASSALSRGSASAFLSPSPTKTTPFPSASPPPLSSSPPYFESSFLEDVVAEFLNFVFTKPSKHPLFHIVFSFIMEQYSGKIESNLNLIRDFLKSLSIVDAAKRKAHLKTTLTLLKEKGCALQPSLTFGVITPDFIEVIGEVLGEKPFTPSTQVAVKSDLDPQKGALFHLLDRCFLTYQSYKFILLTFNDNNKCDEVLGISMELIQLLTLQITHHRNGRPYMIVMSEYLDQLSENYTDVIKKNLLHILLNSENLDKVFDVKAELFEGSISLPEAIKSLEPHEDLILGHTHASIERLKPMLDLIKERIQLMYKLIVFRLVISETNYESATEVKEAITRYMQPTHFATLIKSLTASERSLYSHHTRLKTYIKQTEDLITPFLALSKEDLHHSKIIRSLFETSKRSFSPQKKGKSATAKATKITHHDLAPPAAKFPLSTPLDEEIPLLKFSIKSPTNLLVSNPDLTSLTSFSQKALQITFKYAETLFALKTVIQQTSDPLKLPHLYLDLLIASHYCLEQAATACLAFSDKETFDAMISAGGHSLLHRYSLAGILDLPKIKKSVATVEGVEYAIRGMPFSAKSHRALRTWVKIKEADIPLKVQSLKEEILLRLSHTFRTFFETIKTLPQMRGSINEAQLELFLSEELGLLEEVTDSARDSFPDSILTALRDLNGFKSALIAKQEAKTISLVQTLCFKINRLEHALFYFRNPDIVDFMFAQFRLLEIELLEIALSLRQYQEREDAHDLIALATELKLPLGPDEVEFLRSVKALRNIARYSEMSAPIIRKDPTYLEAPLFECSKAGAGSEEGFVVVKSARQLSAEKELSQELPIVCSILEKALSIRGLI